MRPEEFRNHLRKRPFVPFRVHLSNGDTYDVRHPELAIVSAREIIISRGAKNDDIPEGYVYCDPLHIKHVANSQ
jgi:hypothetical protein